MAHQAEDEAAPLPLCRLPRGLAQTHVALVVRFNIDTTESLPFSVKVDLWVESIETLQRRGVDLSQVLNPVAEDQLLGSSTEMLAHCTHVRIWCKASKAFRTLWAFESGRAIVASDLPTLSVTRIPTLFQRDISLSEVGHGFRTWKGTVHIVIQTKALHRRRWGRGHLEGAAFEGGQRRRLLTGIWGAAQALPTCPPRRWTCEWQTRSALCSRTTAKWRCTPSRVS